MKNPATEETVENISPANSNIKSEISLRNQCVDIIKHISNGVYCLSPTDTLLEVKSLLNNVDSYIDNYIPTLSGLPIRQKLSRKQKLVIHSKYVPTPLNSEIARMFLVHRTTLWRRLKYEEKNLVRHTMINDSELMSVMREIVNSQPHTGVSMMIGHLKAKGISATVTCKENSA
ncbi:unnamed protein product [Mytilus coruscus]|uniref:Uncharacterized protein n=1 Tax=Mytilus coruscus TaxID=42192 RepID=A0A6J8CG94_MYTCO|nr:unnamed protein product [Mytilus coruscus]